MNYLKQHGAYFVFLAALLWACDAPFRVYVGENLPTSIIVLVEHFIGLLIVAPFLWQYRATFKKLTMRQWMAALLIGIGGSAVALMLFTQAFTYMNPSIVIVLQKLQPLIAITLAITLLNERTTKQFWLWSLVMIVGAYLITFPGLKPELYQGEVFNPHVIGMSLALGAALLWGLATVMGRYMLNELNFKALTGLRFSIGFLFLLIWNISRGSLSSLSLVTGIDVLFLVIISLISGVGALFIYYYGLQRTKASVATLAELGFPVGAVIVNYFFLDATLSIVQLIGIGILLYGLRKLA
jgi:drug/metabolite transporter (DMT)-like permease